MKLNYISRVGATQTRRISHDGALERQGALRRRRERKGVMEETIDSKMEKLSNPLASHHVIFSKLI